MLEYIVYLKVEEFQKESGTFKLIDYDSVVELDVLKSKNKEYCECMGLYWVRKNTKEQNYLGLNIIIEECV